MSHPLQSRPAIKAHETDEADAMSRITPSWFPEEHDDAGFPDGAETWAPGRLPPRPAARTRATVSRAELLARERYYRSFPHEGDTRAILSRRRSMRGVYVVAGLLAMFAGSATGIVFANFPAIMAKARVLTASVAAETGGTTTITKKLVPTATLEVSDVSGDLNSFIPLMLKAEPATLGEPLAI